ncbi:hypothetical protein GCM10027275_03840 [Rhabdobacter roseus]|uniref:DNA-binding LytR/AlgR family response regulator n=1 Tax=Rhabdobacter roseus TaxID=1655419 RepID=A0A840TM14_9BACT|nr:response regulator [Rhabdobacter roseus]MBB5282273.1 DNA-binding LytR/AlgR family response regulator [Rhabdobacter roseus]
MTQSKISILLVEDEAILAMELSDTLTAEGYLIAGVANNGPAALDIFQKENIDLLICDINIKGNWDGIETVQRVMAIRAIPIIYLTALADHDTLERAKQTYPAAYIPKPYNLTNLRMAIEMAINNFALRSSAASPAAKPKNPDLTEGTSGTRETPNRETILQVNDHIFIKSNYRFIKIALGDILFLEAENNYTIIQTSTQKFALRQSLGNILDRLSLNNLVRTHRSFAVNLDRVESFNDYEIKVGDFEISLGRNYKDEFFHHFNFR